MTRHLRLLEWESAPYLIAPLAFVVVVGLGAVGVLEPWDLQAARIGLVVIATFSVVCPPAIEAAFRPRSSPLPG